VKGYGIFSLQTIIFISPPSIQLYLVHSDFGVLVVTIHMYSYYS